MDEWNRTVSDVLGLFKSWIPWRSEPAHVSRDFWMPDQSCRVCYECDSQFTLFYRRHHCRHCGRIFCANCTSHWVPTEPSEPKASPEEGDKIRVCNYCFKLWEQRLMVPLLNGLQAADLDASSTSISVTSFLSTRSSIACGSSGITYAMLPPQSAGFTQHQSAVMESDVERESAEAIVTNDLPVGIGEPTWSQHRVFCQNRSDDEDEEFETPHFSQVNGYYDQSQFDDTNTDYKLHKVYPDGDAADTKSISSSPVRNSFDSQVSEEIQQTASEGVKHDISDECEPSSSLYVSGDVNAEPMDFENNGVLWLPPEPEDEEDEREALLFEEEEEEEEEGNAAGEWGGLHHSRSFGSGESRSKDKSTEEHKIALKNVVSCHFRALVAQLLQVENLLDDDENENGSWLEIITALSWEAATLLKPDTSKGGQMDPAGYVKVKCLASGLRNASLVVKGIVCKKNVAHRRMTSKIEKPRLLILGGALEYQRVSNALSSFDTLLQQEMDHLKMAVAKIDAHDPHILLVEKSVSRYAQEYLLAKDITLVLNIKKPLLERIARCTGTQIVPSVDHLSSTKLGYCDMFHVERVLEEHGAAGQAGKKLGKTLMYFEGCPKPLGCTILLRGAHGDELKKVKHVVQYGIFAAYHLALETSFLADEGASLPELPLNSPITVALPDKPSIIDRSISTIPSYFAPASKETPWSQTVGEPLRASTVPTSDLIKIAFASTQRSLGTCNVSGSVTSLYPGNLSPHYVKGSPLSSVEEPSLHPSSEDRGHGELGFSKNSESHSVAVTRDTHITGDFGDGNAENILTGDSCDNRNFSDPPSLQLDGKENLEEQPALKEDFPPPADHQSILVSLSSRCVWKGTICEIPNLFRIKYYSKNDKPLGRFLRDHLFDQNYTCSSCEMPAEAHVQCYTHRQDTLTISVKKLSEVLLPGERDGKIWMWHRCLRCPRTNGFPPATSRVVMSDAAWGLSFGKFLELSFSNNAAASRVASCGHSLHRDCLRFYGFGKMVACFRYAAIDVFSVHLPLPKLDFNCESQEWIERELNEVTGRAELLFSEILNSLLLVEKQSSSGLRDSTMNIRDPRSQITVLEGMLQDEKSQFEVWLRQIVDKDANNGQAVVDILELYRLRRELFFLSYVWDHRLRCAALSDANDQSNDAEITSTEKILDTNVPINMGIHLSASESDAADAKPQQPDNGVIDMLRKCADVIHLRTDLYVNIGHGNQTPLVLSSGMKATDESDPLVSGVTVRRALSDGQSPICLSDTLDAAWTGESHPGLGTPKNNCSSESVEADTSSTVGESNKLDVEEHKQDLSMSKVSQSLSLFSTKSSDSVEEPASWLSTPFLSFYRSYKNFLGTPQKLDKISEYDPVYISSFRESELQSGACWSLPVGVNGTTVPVYEDEPTSIISYTLLSPDYVAQLSDETDRPKDTIESMVSMQSLDVGAFQSFHSLEETMLESYRNLGSGDESMASSMSPHSSLTLESLSHVKSLDARVSFLVDGSLGKAKYTVTCYHANCFKALREICCPSEVDYIKSLSRCKKWGAQGGKSNVFFAKTLDDRLIVKQVTKTELESFVKFAPSYFKYLTESIHSRSPTCLAKILGIYQVHLTKLFIVDTRYLHKLSDSRGYEVASKQVKGGKETKMDLLVMENLLFRRNVIRLYDLKGSSRSRYNPDSSGSNKVLLDQNLIETMPTSPIFVGDKAKKLIERAVWNDTAFLASIDVMDYSLLVGVDEDKHELVLGIIDFMRQYTWDKHLETWVKASGILGGPKNVSPTVISPKQYKRRFRKAMSTYFFKVLDQWSAPPTTIANQSPTELSEENSQNPLGTTYE